MTAVTRQSDAATYLAPAHAMPAEAYVLLREFVRARTGIVYSAARRSIFENRVLTRISALNLRDAYAYARYLELHPRRDEEFLELVSVLTNNETYFLRERAALDVVVDQLAKRVGRRKLRVLSAGASSGEELSSLAILLREAGLDLDQFELQGVDIDVRMVRAASEGVYRAKSFRSIDPERIVRFFVPEGDSRRLKPSILRHLDYRWANLVDPATLQFPHQFDVILCRNVLIYFDAATIEKVVRDLHRLLLDDGMLVVGLSESLAHIPFLFNPERHNGSVLYRKMPL